MKGLYRTHCEILLGSSRFMREYTHIEAFHKLSFIHLYIASSSLISSDQPIIYLLLYNIPYIRSPSFYSWLYFIDPAGPHQWSLQVFVEPPSPPPWPPPHLPSHIIHPIRYLSYAKPHLAFKPNKPPLLSPKPSKWRFVTHLPIIFITNMTVNVRRSE